MQHNAVEGFSRQARLVLGQPPGYILAYGRTGLLHMHQTFYVLSAVEATAIQAVNLYEDDACSPT